MAYVVLIANQAQVLKHASDVRIAYVTSIQEREHIQKRQ